MEQYDKTFNEVLIENLNTLPLTKKCVLCAIYRYNTYKKYIFSSNKMLYYNCKDFKRVGIIQI